MDAIWFFNSVSEMVIADSLANRVSEQAVGCVSVTFNRVYSLCAALRADMALLTLSLLLGVAFLRACSATMAGLKLVTPAIEPTSLSTR